MKRKTDIYLSWVAWSNDDQAYIGRSPDLFHGGVHGDDPIKVATKQQQVIDEWEVILAQSKSAISGSTRQTHRGVRVRIDG